jgi:hypothetical protein
MIHFLDFLPMMNVNLHVERLILDGMDIPSRQQPAFQEAVIMELTRLITEGSLQLRLEADSAIHEMPAGTVQLSNGNEPTELGQQIARAVYGGIGQ